MELQFKYFSIPDIIELGNVTPEMIQAAKFGITAKQLLSLMDNPARDILINSCASGLPYDEVLLLSKFGGYPNVVEELVDKFLTNTPTDNLLKHLEIIAADTTLSEERLSKALEIAEDSDFEEHFKFLQQSGDNGYLGSYASLLKFDWSALHYTEQIALRDLLDEKSELSGFSTILSLCDTYEDLKYCLDGLGTLKYSISEDNANNVLLSDDPVYEYWRCILNARNVH